ncbi:HIT family protein [Propionibacterium freudenreichii]|uniref:HIT family protein n=1 Tax=Propionibacterium freudenreichii TaxID=1744 RepID=UPI00254A2449|nr:HIT family protein [Propionibacterium freudenreichii]
MSTLFTKIINGDIPGRFAWADDTCVVFATIAPITDGHMLVVPRAEVPKFTAADDALLDHLMNVAKVIGQACEQAFDSPRAALLIGGFEIEHLPHARAAGMGRGRAELLQCPRRRAGRRIGRRHRAGARSNYATWASVPHVPPAMDSAALA